jgi:hypothetical protein
MQTCIPFVVLVLAAVSDHVFGEQHFRLARATGDGDGQQYRLNGACIGVDGKASGSKVVLVDCTGSQGKFLWQFQKDSFELEGTGLCISITSSKGFDPVPSHPSALSAATLKRCDSSDVGQHFTYESQIIKWVRHFLCPQTHNHVNFVRRCLLPLPVTFTPLPTTSTPMCQPSVP